MSGAIVSLCVRPHHFLPTKCSRVTEQLKPAFGGSQQTTLRMFGRKHVLPCAPRSPSSAFTLSRPEIRVGARRAGQVPLFEHVRSHGAVVEHVMERDGCWRIRSNTIYRRTAKGRNGRRRLRSHEGLRSDCALSVVDVATDTDIVWIGAGPVLGKTAASLGQAFSRCFHWSVLRDAAVSHFGTAGFIGHQPVPPERPRDLAENRN